MQPSLKPYFVKAPPELMNRADRIVDAFPAIYRRSRSELIRQAIEDLLIRREAELAEAHEEQVA